jgi:hypothetical protein
MNAECLHGRREICQSKHEALRAHTKKHGVCMHAFIPDDMVGERAGMVSTVCGGKDAPLDAFGISCCGAGAAAAAGFGGAEPGTKLANAARSAGMWGHSSFLQRSHRAVDR